MKTALRRLRSLTAGATFVVTAKVMPARNVDHELHRPTAAKSVLPTRTVRLGMSPLLATLDGIPPMKASMDDLATTKVDLQAISVVSAQRSLRIHRANDSEKASVQATVALIATSHGVVALMRRSEYPRNLGTVA